MLRYLSLIVLSLAVSTGALAQGLDDCSGPRYFSVNVGAATNTTIHAAVAGKKARVLAYVLTADTVDGLVQFEDGLGGPELTGFLTFADNGQLVVNCAPYGCFETSDNTLLNLNVQTSAIDGHIIYALCD